MKRWEYKILYGPYQSVETLGADGWELVSVSPGPNNVDKLYFRREIKPLTLEQLILVLLMRFQEKLKRIGKAD